MTLPIDLVLVRHGESEENALRRRSEADDNSAFTEEIRNKHTASFRLSGKGQRQASQAGTFIRKEFFKNGIGFDRYITSEYLRAMETAGLLELPDAVWLSDFYLTERDWGQLDGRTESEREEKFGVALRRRKMEPFFWKPPNGESFAELCLRVDRVLHTLHRECSEKRVLIVCHGEVMHAFQIRLERMSQRRFREVILREDRRDIIYNCQILHYTRRNPENGDLAPYAEWKRWIRPTEEPITTSGWEKIKRPRYSNSELLAIADQTPALLV